MRYGFTGKNIRVDLSKGKISFEKVENSVYETFLGGKGFSAQLLFKELEAGTPPLSQENKLIFMTGPLTGTAAVTGDRFCCCTRSPLTGTWLDSHCGGFWGPELKFAGFDGIIIEGASPNPVYLLIEDENVTIEDANDLWGKDTFKTLSTLRKRHKTDRTVRVASIGPCGEKLGLLANIIADVRTAGRGGAGAVMGSKKLKAISVVGHGKVDIFDQAGFRKACQTAFKKVRENETTSVSLTYYGTDNIALTVNEVGGWPTRNFQSNYFEDAEKLSGETLAKELWKGGRAWRPCYGCMIKCSHYTTIRHKGEEVEDEGPEYETIWAFGPQCGISDPKTITIADYLCDSYGMDTISLGNTIGFLMECYEKGLITKSATDGIEMRFGEEEALLKTVQKAGSREDKFGILVSNGVKRASEHIGKGSEKFAMHVKGLEIPAYDPRSAQGMALAYSLADRGACHLRPWTYGAEHLGTEERIDPYTLSDKPHEVKTRGEKAAIVDSTGICIFSTFAISVEEDVFNLINAATGFDYTLPKFMQIGERIVNLTRSFNVREGFSKKDDMLPWRAVNEPAPKGGCKGMTAKSEKILSKYYHIAGWTENGIPKKGKLLELGLNFVIKMEEYAT